MIKLLIVEDDEKQIELFKDTIESVNKKAEKIFDEPDYRTELESSIKALERKTAYDAAIIDLKLKAGSGADEFEGKELIARIYNRIRIPIVVYSGNVSQVEEEETSLFLKRPRDRYTISDILTEVKKIFDTGITEILSAEGTLDNNLSQIFWSHLAPNLKYWISQPDKKSLTRYVLSHIYEKLEIDDYGDFENYNSAEVFIMPPIKKNIHTGDVFVTDSGSRYLVITPSCDIEIKKKKKTGELFRKADYLTVLKINEFDLKIYCQDKEGKIDKGLIHDFVSNKSNRFQYLPPYLNDNGFIIDFEEVMTLKINIDTMVNRIASVTQVFLKDIISRFSQYYARQGQPLFAKSEELILKLSQVK